MGHGIYLAVYCVADRPANGFTIMHMPYILGTFMHARTSPGHMVPQSSCLYWSNQIEQSSRIHFDPVGVWLHCTPWTLLCRCTRSWQYYKFYGYPGHYQPAGPIRSSDEDYVDLPQLLSLSIISSSLEWVKQFCHRSFAVLMTLKVLSYSTY